jgi:adhesin/invasin
MRRIVLGPLVAAVACAAALGAHQATGATRACPDSNPPNTLVLSGGTPQTARVGSAFAQPLQVALANTNGCPVTSGVGTPVTFSAPSTGASGTFSASGSYAVTVGTDASGSASGGQFTPNGVAGWYTVVASSSYGSVSFSLANTAAGVPLTIAAQAPSTQSAKVGSRYAAPLEAVVRDANGNPLQGVSVSFVLGPGGTGPGASFDGGGSQVTEVTDAAGVATSPHFSANEVVGSFLATASTQGIVEPTGFSLTNLAAPSPRFTAVGRAKQTTVVGSRFGRPLEVRLRNADGSPVVGASVSFTLGAASAAAGASFAGGSAQATATTDAHGIAVSPRPIANTVAGSFVATAVTTATSETVDFSLQNHAGRPAAIAAGAGAVQTTVVGSRFAIRLAVTVTDTHGNPVPGAKVTFAAPRQGAAGRFGRRRTVTVKTDARGIAVAPAFSANRAKGGYVVRARVAGAPGAVAFALVNR